MKKIFCLFVSALLFTQSAWADHLKPNIHLAARLSGAQEAPPVNTPATGEARFVFNLEHHDLLVDVQVRNLTGRITAAHLHRGRPGTPGPVVIDLGAGIRGWTIHHRVRNLTRQQVAELLSGEYYINVHTAAHPSGEIRGQVWTERDLTFVAEMTGGQETPPVVTGARGLAIFNLSKDRRSLEFFGVTTGLKIRAIHLHIAPAGTPGPVLVNLGPFVADSVYFRGRVPVTPRLLSAMLHDSIYVNAHTLLHPGGEIRGQLRHRPALYFDSRMTGGQEVPPRPTDAVGLAVLMLNHGMDSLRIMGIIGDSLSSPIIGSHIHAARRGTNGPVVVDLSPYRTGQWINGTISGPMLTRELIRRMYTGGTYINVHTTMFPGGEIRGQIYRSEWHGHPLAASGAREDIEEDGPALAGLLPRDAALRLLPNPAGATLQAAGLTEAATLTLHTPTGSQALRAVLQPGQPVDISALPPGMYFYRLETGQAHNAGMLLKQ